MDYNPHAFVEKPVSMAIGIVNTDRMSYAYLCESDKPRTAFFASSGETEKDALQALSDRLESALIRVRKEIVKW